MCDEISTARRQLLTTCAAAAISALPAAIRAAEQPTPNNQLASLIRDKRSLWLVRGSEQLKVTYWSAVTGSDRNAYYDVCWLMRDVQADRVFAMDRRLLDVLCGIQTWLARSGVEAPLMIHSGYRTRRTNSKLEGAALDSRHLVGRAADISVPGVTNVKLAGMASILGHGGTGFYVGKGFVHVDSGDERIWVDQSKKKPPSN